MDYTSLMLSACFLTSTTDTANDFEVTPNKKTLNMFTDLAEFSLGTELKVKNLAESQTVALLVLFSLSF